MPEMKNNLVSINNSPHTTEGFERALREPFLVITKHKKPQIGALKIYREGELEARSILEQANFKILRNINFFAVNAYAAIC